MFAAHNVPGDLFEEPFIDFATSRNRLMKLAGQHAEFLFLLNGDDRLVGGPKLRELLEVCFVCCCEFCVVRVFVM